MKQQEQYFVESLNRVLDLQIDAIHELLEAGSNDSANRHNFHLTILRRKQMVDKLEALILSHGGKIDKRTNITSTPHQVSAKYDNGILKVSLPKKEEAKPKPPKQIRIS